MTEHNSDLTRGYLNPYLGKRLLCTATLQKYSVRLSLRYTLAPSNRPYRSPCRCPRSRDKRLKRTND